VREDSTEGWYTDPYARHEARWMSQGSATGLVRDGITEGHDDPIPGEPFTSKAVRIKYVERQLDQEQGGGFLHSKGGIVVPGGIVTIEPHAKSNSRVPSVRILLRSMFIFGAMQTRRDIVVWDEQHQQQLYRDGPYDAITVNNPLKRIVAELNQHGVHEFISERGGSTSRTVSVTRDNPNQAYERAALTGVEYYWERFVRIFKGRG
jgi:hypothetical protein